MEKYTGGNLSYEMKGPLQNMWAWQNINRDLLSHFLPEEIFTSFSPTKEVRICYNFTYTSRTSNYE